MNSNKLVCGVGTKGDGVARVNGKLTKAYAAWDHMLRRCYSPKWLSRYPTYTGCSVCEEWQYFPTFKEWFDENYIEDWQLDKDLLVPGNKIYGPNTCVFVPQCINKLFTDSGRIRGEYLIGVDLHKPTGKFRALLSIDGAQKHLGLFDNANEAHQAYIIAKRENIIRMTNKWKAEIPSRLYIALLTKAENMLVE